MKLIDNWDVVLRRAWSARLALLTSALTGLAGVWDVFMGNVPTWLYVSVGMAIPLAVTLARIIDQDID